MNTASSTTAASLRLHLVPAGRRLDFDTAPGQYAYVYRRCQNQSWQCVAHNACSPFLDQAPLAPEAAPEYVVRYRDAAGTPVADTSVVRADPAKLPGSPSWFALN